MNPDKDVDRTRLFRALDWSYRKLEPFRTLTTNLVQEYVGTGYGNPSRRPRYETLLNLMNQTVDAYTMSLVANRPRVMVSTKKPQLRYFARQFETAVNNLIEEIKIEYTLRQAVLDAFFCVGIVKVQMADSAPVQLDTDLWSDPGMPFAANVSIENWVHDMAATKYSRIQYAGDWYRIPWSDLQGPMFIQENVRDIPANSKHRFGEGETQRLSQLATGEEVDPDELEPMVDLLDVWVPRDKKIYTFPIDPQRPFGGGQKPVAVLDWNGPEFGPYHLLSFNDVPENILPTSPAQHLSGLSRIINNIARKQSRKAHGQKEVYTVPPGDQKDGDKVRGASDQEFVVVADPKEIGTIKTGGVDAALQAYMQSLVQVYDRMAGNLPAMLGLSSQAPTLGQEQLLQSAVSKKEAMMQYRVLDFARGLIRDLGFMLWTDQAKTIPATLEIPGLDEYQPVDATWTPEDREGDFFDYNFAIDIFSMPYQSPAQKFQALIGLVTQVFAPAGPMLMAQGGQINFQKIAEVAAEYLNIPVVSEVIEFSAPIMQQGADEPDMPPATTRSYVRRNVPTGGTPQYQAQQSEQAWLDQASRQPAQQTSA